MTDDQPSKRAQMWAEAIGSGIAGGIVLFLLIWLFPYLVRPAHMLLCIGVTP